MVCYLNYFVMTLNLYKKLYKQICHFFISDKFTTIFSKNQNDRSNNFTDL